MRFSHQPRVQWSNQDLARELGLEQQQHLHTYSRQLVQEMPLDTSLWWSSHILWKTENSPGWLYIIWPHEAPRLPQWSDVWNTIFFSDQSQRQVEDITWISSVEQVQYVMIVKTPTFSAAFWNIFRGWYWCCEWSIDLTPWLYELFVRMSLLGCTLFITIHKLCSKLWFPEWLEPDWSGFIQLPWNSLVLQNIVFIML